MSRNFFVDKKQLVVDDMGSCFSSKHAKIRIIDNIEKGKRYGYLRPKCDIILTMDKVYNVPMININFVDWLVNSVRLWLKTDSACHCFQCWLERTPLYTPSNLSCYLNSLVDTVH